MTEKQLQARREYSRIYEATRRNKEERKAKARERRQIRVKEDPEFVEKSKSRLAAYYFSMEGRHAALKAELKREGIPNSDMLWSFSFYRELVSEGLCHYCFGATRATSHGHGLDRKDNILGHSCFNTVPCCKSCNDLKGVRLSYEEMMLLAPVLRKIREQREAVIQEN